MTTTFAVDRQTVHQIVREALRCAAVESTPNEAIDVLGDALTLHERLITQRRCALPQLDRIFIQ